MAWGYLEVYRLQVKARGGSHLDQDSEQLQKMMPRSVKVKQGAGALDSQIREESLLSSFQIEIISETGILLHHIFCTMVA